MTFNSPEKTLKARVTHQCTNCAESILIGENYQRWVTFDDAAFTNKMHPECLESLRPEFDYGPFEYTQYGGERPHD